MLKQGHCRAPHYWEAVFGFHCTNICGFFGNKWLLNLQMVKWLQVANNGYQLLLISGCCFVISSWLGYGDISITRHIWKKLLHFKGVIKRHEEMLLHTMTDRCFMLVEVWQCYLMDFSNIQRSKISGFWFFSGFFFIFNLPGGLSRIKMCFKFQHSNISTHSNI